MPKTKDFSSDKGFVDYSDEAEDFEEKHFQKDFDEWNEKMTGMERLAIRSYSLTAYQEMNGYLRNDKVGSGENEMLETLVHDATTALDKFNIKQNTMAYRYSSGDMMQALGITFDAKNPQDFINQVKSKAGSIFQDKAFVSTSTRQGIWEGDVKYEIGVPKGTHGAYIGHISTKGHDEKELLLNRGTKFKVMGAHMDGNQVVVSLQVEK